MPAVESTRAASRWATRVIPFILVVAVGYATYVTVARVCVEYWISKRRAIGPPVVVLVLHFLFLLLMIAAYLRVFVTVTLDCGVVPLGPLAVQRRQAAAEKTSTSHADGELESYAYYSAPDPDPDSPGLEQFYSKDVFVCESDGRPKWCSECCNWKPDRVHHSSEINRCVYRMDHYCPWVGGMIGENSFKFFVQFTLYAACYCAVDIGAIGAALHQDSAESVDPHKIAALVIAGFFGFFALVMSITSIRYTLLNMTNIDMLSIRSKVYQLAVRVPPGTPPSDKYSMVTYPLPQLELGINGEANRRPPLGPDSDTPNGRETMATARRDGLATRTFAILKTQSGENPWDLGFYQNWKAVMGTNPIDWLMPVRKSPCVNHESSNSFYPMGRVLAQVCARNGVAGPAASEGGDLEMKEMARDGPAQTT